MKFFVVISSLLVLATARPDISLKKGKEYSKPPADFNQNNYYAVAPLPTNYGGPGSNFNGPVNVVAKSNLPPLVNSNYEFSTVAPSLEYSTVSPFFKSYGYPSSGPFVSSFNGFGPTPPPPPPPLLGNVEFSTPTPAPFVPGPSFEYSTPAPILKNIELSSTPAPFLTPNKLFGGDFSSYGPGFDYVSSTVPPFYDNGDFSPAYFGNDYSRLFNRYYSNPQIYQTFQNGFNTNAGFATGPVRHVNVQTEIITQAPIITKNFYVHDIPEGDDEIVARQRVILPPPQKNVKVIFIKAPTPVGIAPAINIPQVQNEEKTIVYVLVKKPQDIDQEVIVPPAPTRPTKPEVYFIKYKGNDPAETIKTIQNQYVVNDVNREGSLPALEMIVTNVGETVENIGIGIQEVAQGKSFPPFPPSVATVQDIFGGIGTSSLPPPPAAETRFTGNFGYGAPFPPVVESGPFLTGNYVTSTTPAPVVINSGFPTTRFSELSGSGPFSTGNYVTTTTQAPVVINSGFPTTRFSDLSGSGPVFQVSEPVPTSFSNGDFVTSTTPSPFSFSDTSFSTSAPVNSFPSVRFGSELTNDNNFGSPLFNIPSYSTKTVNIGGSEGRKAASSIKAENQELNEVPLNENDDEFKESI